MSDDDLERFFTAARRNPAEASDVLLTRVLQDAQQHQRAAALAPPRRAGWWRRLSLQLGGAPVLAGLGTAMVMGLMVGYIGPSVLSDLTGTTAPEADGAFDLFSAAGLFVAEG
ncbi:MAG: hypothetical protein HC844_11065 [Tabrizicola sp.]|nr:hypothetical protein [Tabrizicola sp.]